jgi:predicted nucleotidyltransferase
MKARYERLYRSFPLSMTVLFGSHTDGTAHAHSDLGVAVRFEDTVSDSHSVQLLDELTAELTRASGFEAIDLLDRTMHPRSWGTKPSHRGRYYSGTNPKRSSWKDSSSSGCWISNP